jgi:hypothetical protein
LVVGYSILVSAWCLSCTGVQLTSQCCVAVFVNRVTAPLLRFLIRQLSWAATHLVVYTWWCSPRKVRSNLQCVQLCAAAAYVWALRSFGVAIDAVPNQPAGRSRRKQSSLKVNSRATVKQSATAGER